MNSSTPPNLEDRLARTPRRGLPADLRQACLAMRGSVPRPTPPTRQHAFWLHWFWPHPAAWGGLAILWCTILALHRLAPVPVNVLAATGPSTPLIKDPDSNRQLAHQRETREELLRQPLPPLDIDRPRKASPPSTNRIA